ncbi:glycoside hydrolase family 3 protein [Ornithinimicrobium cryptoxanthini]|uniref:beta-glucosidase n=1 Tax=Ornithinimicrobium cryptoxanthini TaxID=2934161 RepID=A0ABY4YDY0_9MICO|nr:glycoside hydrolase family 3 N-terminal domain-containing protein [Ornithinimicrobium cryptoxanthini]USQ74764.1 glycoside hydrolase family 3 protein [Ornithinimicrobium cryptoxanthini]
MSDRPSSEQPRIGARSKATIEVDGLVFRDLDGDQHLSPYEDWRLTPQERADDLVSRMTLDEKAGLMLIDTVNAGWGGTVTELAEDYIGRGHMRRIIFRNVVAVPGEERQGDDSHPFVAGSSVTPEQAASFLNAVQDLAEGSRLGIPVLAKSNARNHIDPDARAGINESHGAFSGFPKEAGLAAAALGADSMDPVVAFAEVMGAEWHAIGLRGMYGYMVDLITEPRWYRTHECFSEDAALTSRIVTALLQTLQGSEVVDGSSLNPTTDVALTIKHFPGGGPQERGLDPHYSFGKTQVYPGDNFGQHLEPFRAAIAGGAAAIMPYYGVPMGVTHDGVTYDQIGMAFSDEIVTGLLRDSLGFAGYVNSDTGIVTDRAWGLEEVTIPQRVAAAINSGTDTLSGFHDITVITSLVESGLVSQERVDLAAVRLLVPLFRMGLFEDPYVEEEAANDILATPRHTDVALDIQRKSVVLLQNQDRADGSGPALPLQPGSTVFVLGTVDTDALTARGFTVVDGNAEDRPSAAGADHVLVSLSALTLGTGDYRSADPNSGMRPDKISPVVFPGVRGLDGKSPFGAADAGVAYGAPTCTDDGLPFGGPLPWESGVLDFSGMEEAESWSVRPSLRTIQEVMREVDDPTKVVLDVYFRQPFVLDQGSGLRDAGAIVATFGISGEALLDVLTGAFAPQGRMPFALAASSLAIEEQSSDLPGYDDTTDGALYGFGHGLTF